MKGPPPRLKRGKRALSSSNSLNSNKRKRVAVSVTNKVNNSKMINSHHCPPHLNHNNKNKAAVCYHHLKPAKNNPQRTTQPATDPINY